MIAQSERSLARQSFPRRVAALIEGSDKTQAEIARALGYPNPNIITMFKNGKTRIPMGKVAPFALAIGQDPGPLLLRWLEAYEPDAVPHITHLGRVAGFDEHDPASEADECT